MTNTEALNQINVALRALFVNFKERIEAERPEKALSMADLALTVSTGETPLVFQIAMLPDGIRLEAGVFSGDDATTLTSIFNSAASSEVIPAFGSPVWQ